MENSRASYPEFSEAVGQLSAFLRRQSWPDQIAWLRPSAVTTQGQIVVVNPQRFRSLGEVQAIYDEAACFEFGVELAGLTHDDTTSYCYIWRPASAREAEEHLMPLGLKLSLAATPHAIRLESGIRFRWRRAWGPPSDLFQQMMT